MTAPNCPGIRDGDSVRPIASCQSCACWLSTSPQKVAPAIVVVYGDGAKPALQCNRRVPVQG